jgi:hypothetical protein
MSCNSDEKVKWCDVTVLNAHAPTEDKMMMTVQNKKKIKKRVLRGVEVADFNAKLRSFLQNWLSQ